MKQEMRATLWLFFYYSFGVLEGKYCKVETAFFDQKLVWLFSKLYNKEN